MLICEYKDKYFECSQRLFWFSKLMVIGSPPRLVISLAAGSWLNVQFEDNFPLAELAIGPVRELLVTTKACVRATRAPLGYSASRIIIAAHGHQIWGGMLLASLLWKPAWFLFTEQLNTLDPSVSSNSIVRSFLEFFTQTNSKHRFLSSLFSFLKGIQVSSLYLCGILQ